MNRGNRCTGVSDSGCCCYPSHSQAKHSCKCPTTTTTTTNSLIHRLLPPLPPSFLTCKQAIFWRCILTRMHTAQAVCVILWKVVDHRFKLVSTDSHQTLCTNVCFVRVWCEKCCAMNKNINTGDISSSVCVGICACVHVWTGSSVCTRLQVRISGRFHLFRDCNDFSNHGILILLPVSS